ncbi:MAG: hypothetical protein QXU17_02705 [Archaeoglobaceae archaeon]
MRVVKKGNTIEIVIREDIPYFEDYVLSNKLRKRPIYSKNRELVKFTIYQGSEDFEEIIPEAMPFRKYVLTFGKEFETPKICVDDLRDIPLCSYFELPELLIVEKMDGGGFDYFELSQIRQQFLDEWISEGWPLDFERPIIESYYFNRKLYFYVSSESYYVSSFREFVETFTKYLESFESETTEIKENNDRHAFISTKNKTYLLLYRGYDEENDVEDEKFGKEELFELIGNRKKSIEVIVEDYDILDALEKDAIDWLKEKGYKVKTLDDFMADYMLKEWRWNDEYAETEPEEVKELIESIFC